MEDFYEIMLYVSYTKQAKLHLFNIWKFGSCNEKTK